MGKKVHKHKKFSSLLLVVLLLITAFGYPLSALAVWPLDLTGQELIRIVIPIKIGPTPVNQLPIGEVSQAINNTKGKTFGLGSNLRMGLALRNGNKLSMTFSPRRGGFFRPRGGGIQGMVIVGATVTILGGLGAPPALAAPMLEERATSFTVQPGETVEVLLDAVCIDYYNEDRTGTMPLPPKAEVDFLAEEPGRSSILTEDQNSKLTKVLDVLADYELFTLVIIGDPELASEIFLTIGQWSTWAVTDGLTYVNLKKHLEEHDGQVDEIVQIYADLINLVLEEAKATTPEEPFAPPWDVNWDFEVDILDLVLVGIHFGERVQFPFPNPDVNRDELVDISDLVQVGLHFGERYDMETKAAPELLTFAHSKENIQPRSVGARGFTTVVSRLGNSLHDRHFNLTYAQKTPTLMHTKPEKRTQMPAGVRNPTRVWIQPDKVSEHGFTAMVMVDSVQDLHGYQFDLVYEPTFFEVVDVSEGTLLKRDGTKTYWLNPSAKGKIRVASVRIGKKGVDGSGTLATINFKVKNSALRAGWAARYPRLALSSVKLSDQNANLIPVLAGDALYLAELKVPQHSALLPSYPNPSNPETWIPFQLAEMTEVTITIYNASGQPVRVLSLGQKAAGAYINKARAAYWDGRNDEGEEVSSGIYFYSIKAGNFTDTKKMVLIR